MRTFVITSISENTLSSLLFLLSNTTYVLYSQYKSKIDEGNSSCKAFFGAKNFLKVFVP